jgi:hypothetical protein
MDWPLSSRSLTDEGLFFQGLGVGKLFITIDPPVLDAINLR